MLYAISIFKTWGILPFFLNILTSYLIFKELAIYTAFALFTRSILLVTKVGISLVIGKYITTSKIMHY